MLVFSSKQGNLKQLPASLGNSGKALYVINQEVLG
jgi:hypothetical protein